jgi:hypothetical protein
MHTLVPALLLTILIAASARAQLEYVKAPISIENARLTYPGEPESVPVAVPVSELIDLTGAEGCIQDFPLLEVEVVQNVLEVTYSGAAISGAAGGILCDAIARLQFDILLEVPTVSLDPASFVYSFGEVNGTFTQLRSASFTFGRDGDTFSQQLSRAVGVPLGSFVVHWEPPIGSPSDDSGFGIAFVTMLPGDTVRIPVVLVVQMAGDTDELGDTEGTISAQFEWRTLFPQPVPAPSSSLSLPIGVGALAGLSMLKGGV